MGVFTSTTFGISNSNMVGLSFSTNGSPVSFVGSALAQLPMDAGVEEQTTSLIPSAVSLNWGDNWSIQAYTNRKWVRGFDNKNTGGEYALCRGNKYEMLKGDAYKYLYGKENKMEASKDANKATMIHDAKHYVSHWKTYSSQSTKAQTQGSSTVQAASAVTTQAGGQLKQEGQSVILRAYSGSSTVSAKTTLDLFGDQVCAFGTSSAVLRTSNASVRVGPGSVTIGPQLNAGGPVATQEHVQSALSTLKEQLEAAKAEADAAKAAAAANLAKTASTQTASAEMVDAAV